MMGDYLGQPSSMSHDSLDASDRERFELDLFLETFYRLTGHDFRNYSLLHILRRLKTRMAKEGLPTLTLLLNKLIHEPEFVPDILSDFSIQVTEMFRDPTFFHAFRKEIVPKLRDYRSIYIWHAGCATGEEAISLAILLSEEGLLDRAKIYATDMSQQAIDMAKQGKIPLKRMQVYNRNYILAGGKQSLSDYYSTDEHYAYISPHIVESISFDKHNLATDGSFQAFHVILCRNVLIYFNKGLQNRAHQLFIDSLHGDGFLCLGHKESIFYNNSQDVYHTVNYEEVIYQKKKTNQQGEP